MEKFAFCWKSSQCSSQFQWSCLSQAAHCHLSISVRQDKIEHGRDHGVRCCCDMWVLTDQKSHHCKMERKEIVSSLRRPLRKTRDCYTTDAWRSCGKDAMDVAGICKFHHDFHVMTLPRKASPTNECSTQRSKSDSR